MRDSESFWRALVTVTLALAGGQAAHWFLTPANHPDASAIRTVGVALQGLVGFGGSYWLARRPRPGPVPPE